MGQMDSNPLKPEMAIGKAQIILSICGRSKSSDATVMTDVFHKNEINLLRKFAKIMRIFDKVDDSKNRGVI